MTRRLDATKPARALLAIVALACAFVAFAPRTALAAPSAYWRLSARSAPANLAPGQEGTIILTANNAGDASNTPSEEHPIKITDVLPEGVTATALPSGGVSVIKGGTTALQCTVTPLSCTDATAAILPATGVTVRIKVKVAPTVPSGTVLRNEVKVEGGQAPSESAIEPLRVDEHPAGFGVEKYELRAEDEGGATDTQAGSHPFQLSTALALNVDPSEEPVALAKNLQFTLPAGMIGNPLAVPRCRQVDFNTIVPGSPNLCPADTAVGIAEVTIKEPRLGPSHPLVVTVPVFNVEPAAGEPARLGFTVFKVPVVLETAVRTGSDYAVVVTAKETSEAAGIVSSRVSIWGVPGDARHNSERGWECADGGSWGEQAPAGFFRKCSEQQQPPEVPFLSMPTSCDTPLHAPMQIQSWVPGSEYTSPVESEFQEQLTGCSALEFSPTFATTPDEHSASTPTGLGVEVGMPKNAPQFETPTGLAQSALKATTVTLPEGVQLNPAAAGGLGACSAFEVGFEPGFPESAQTENNHFSPGPFGCNDAAKVGTVSIKSPDLENELKGFVYLGREHTNPFEAPLVIYILAEDCGGTVPAKPECAAPNSGVRVKLSGTVTPNPSNGQLVSTFENNPQVPFESFNLHFFNGPRASLATPAGCGTYTATTSFTPWSGAAAATPSGSFDITSGVGGGGCPGNPLPFGPALTAGAKNTNAGAYEEAFTLTIDKPDGQQPLSGLTMKLPPGLAAMISKVSPCPQSQVASNSCGPESLIGKSLASAGLGGEPFTLPGKVYFTEGYNGAPFGLSVVTPAVAGPFNLGDVTVRSTINVDPSTAAVTINSEPFPTILKGVPTQLKQIKVVVDKPEFQFNPTNCSPMSIVTRLTGAQGGAANAAYPFKAQNCAALSFHPTLVAEVDGRASKPNGTTLKVRVTSGPGQSNIGKTDLTLPIQLPSRLTTIQKACLAATFEANPASCPEGSNIGNALAVTPVLKNPLRGPAYLVSHGNAAFPDVEFVLQGEAGLKLILDGKTDIKKGITYSRFETLPDAPVTLFETTLPAGPHSALTANVPESEHFNLCRQKLTIPTLLTGQNGLLVSQNTKVRLFNCPRVAAPTRAQLLAKAMASCHKRFKHNRAKRNKCVRQAQRKYGAHKASAKHKQKHK
jgi:hypothetical protein